MKRSVAVENINVMRYMGNKRRLLPSLTEVISDRCRPGELVVDLMAGTHAVGFELSERNRITANDVACYSLPVGRALLQRPEGFQPDSYLSLIADAAMFNYIRSHYEAIQRRDLTVMQHLIEHSIQIKSQIVSADLRESGLRKILNFGHTIGHALEMHSALTHGEAISVGMVMAAQLSYRRSYCQASVITGISEVLTRLGLPVQMPIMPDKLANTLFLDKKKINNTIEFIFIEEIGKVRVARIAPAKIIQLLSF